MRTLKKVKKFGENMLKENLVTEPTATAELDEQRKELIEYWIKNIDKLYSLSTELKQKAKEEFIQARTTGTVSIELVQALNSAGSEEKTPAKEEKVTKNYTLSPQNYTDEEKAIISLLKKNLPNKLKEKLEQDYKDANHNDLKFKIADIAIKLDRSECLDVILKSLKKNIPQARKHILQLVKLARAENAERCTETLADYNYNSKADLITHWASFLFSSASTKHQWENDNPFKSAIIEELERKVGL